MNSTRQRNNLLILRGEEVRHGDVTDLVDGSAERRVWERWKNGQSAAAISRALERKNKTGIERIVVVHDRSGAAPESLGSTKAATARIFGRWPSWSKCSH